MRRSRLDVAAQRDQVRISPRGLHWEALDEDIATAGLFAGQDDLSGKRTVAA